MLKIVTVDGPAGSGKSTIAKLLANRIGYTYLDTGSLYRAVTWLLMKEAVNSQENDRIQQLLSKIEIEYRKEGVFIRGEDVTAALRTAEVTGRVAAYAKNPLIRKFVRVIQKHLGEKENFIVDGRDTGSVVFPESFCKFYLDASVQIRAKRRLSDEKESNSAKTLAEIEAEIAARDNEDKNRAESPLKIPYDALVIDTSEMATDQVMEKMIIHFNKRQSAVFANAMGDQDSNKIFQDALKNFDTDRIETGMLLKGRVVEITKKGILLDIGKKRDAIIPAEEFNRIDVKNIHPGETIDVFLLNADPMATQFIVSKFQADKRGALIKIKEAFENKALIEGKVDSRVKGGFLIDLQGNKAFCPYSEFDVKRNIDEKSVLGEVAMYVIMEFKEQADKIVVSRKKPLEEKVNAERTEFFSKLHVGDILEGTVVSIVEYGAFVEFDNGVCGLLRRPNISWKRFDKVSDILHRGDKTAVKVVEISLDRQKLELSRKELEEDPFLRFCRMNPAGTVLEGKIRKLETFGAFVEVDDGLDGLLHISELSWTKRVAHPREVLKVDEKIQVSIKSYDEAGRKISLSLKQALDNPWETIEQKFPVGELVHGIITAVTPSSLIIEIAKEFEGFVAIEDVTWGKEKVKLKKQFKEGDEIEAKVLSHNKQRRRIELGLKQKSANPWEDLRVNYGTGGIISGEIQSIGEMGLVVKLGDEIEGFCHRTQCSSKKIENLESEFKTGETRKFYIQVIDEEAKKVSLSIRAFLEAEERRDIEKYMTGSEAPRRRTLGDLLGR